MVSDVHAVHAAASLVKPMCFRFTQTDSVLVDHHTEDGKTDRDVVQSAAIRGNTEANGEKECQVRLSGKTLW